MTEYEYSTAGSIGAIGVKAPSEVVVALKRGIVRVNVDFNHTGVDIGVYFVGTDEDHTRYTLEGMAKKLGKSKRVSFDVPKPDQDQVLDAVTDDFKVKANVSLLDDRQPEDRESLRVWAETQERGKTSVGPLTFSRAKVLVNDRKLDRHKKQGVLNIYPSKSLAKEDFKRVILEDFQARVVYVAGTLTNAYAIRRIATDPGMKIPGAETLKDWWELATSWQRLALLSDEKNRKGMGHPMRLLLIPCPFQDAGLSTETSDSESA